VGNAAGDGRPGLTGHDVAAPLSFELDGSRGRAVFQAAHRDPGAEIFWHLDEDHVGVTVGIHELALAPGPGPHRLVLVDRDGARVERRFTVLSR